MTNLEKTLLILSLIMAFIAGFVAKGYSEYELLRAYEREIEDLVRERHALENFIIQRPLYDGEEEADHAVGRSHDHGVSDE